MADNPFLEFRKLFYQQQQQSKENEADRALRQQLGLGEQEVQRESIAAANERQKIELEQQKKFHEDTIKQQQLQNTLQQMGLISSGQAEPYKIQPEIGQVAPPEGSADVGGGNYLTPVTKDEQIRREANVRLDIQKKQLAQHQEQMGQFLQEIQKKDPQVFENNPDLKTAAMFAATPGFEHVAGAILKHENLDSLSADYARQAFEAARKGDKAGYATKFRFAAQAAQLSQASKAINPMGPFQVSSEMHAGRLRPQINNLATAQGITDKEGNITDIDKYNRIVDTVVNTAPDVPDGMRNGVAAALKKTAPIKEGKPPTPAEAIGRKIAEEIEKANAGSK